MLLIFRYFCFGYDNTFKKLPGTENPCVPGSNPGPGTNKTKGL